MTRATFFEHAVNPVALLTEVLGEEIGVLAVTVNALPEFWSGLTA